jgi:hypothetical protein
MRGGTNIKHWSLADYAQEWDVENYFKFSCVRNPWDRILSLFYFRNGSFLGTREFAQFIRQDTSQATLSCTEKLSLQGIIGVDFCIRFESLQRDFDVVCDRLDIPRQALPVVNRSSKRQPFSEFYDQHTRQLIADRYRDDIENFGYRFTDDSG